MVRKWSGELLKNRIFHSCLRRILQGHSQNHTSVLFVLLIATMMVSRCKVHHFLPRCSGTGCLRHTAATTGGGTKIQDYNMRVLSCTALLLRPQEEATISPTTTSKCDIKMHSQFSRDALALSVFGIQLLPQEKATRYQSTTIQQQQNSHPTTQQQTTQQISHCKALYRVCRFGASF